MKVILNIIRVFQMGLLMEVMVKQRFIRANEIGESCSNKCYQKNVICNDYVCTCTTYYRVVYDEGQKLCSPAMPGDKCSHNQSHLYCYTNQHCVNGECRCKSPFRSKNALYNDLGGCWKDILGMRCKDTCDIHYSKCVNEICICKANYVSDGFVCVKQFIGGRCTGSKCSIAQTYCSKGVCTCAHNFRKKTNTECKASVPGDFCDKNAPCSRRQTCNLNRCTCNPGYVSLPHEMVCRQRNSNKKRKPSESNTPIIRYTPKSGELLGICTHAQKCESLDLRCFRQGTLNKGKCVCKPGLRIDTPTRFLKPQCINDGMSRDSLFIYVSVCVIAVIITFAGIALMVFNKKLNYPDPIIPKYDSIT